MLIASSTLALFMFAVLMLMLSPGPNMAFVLSHGVAHGPRGGLAAALGISCADLVLTLLSASGVTALVAAWPPSFDLLRYLGALYLLWLALQALRSPAAGLPARQTQAALSRIFFRAMLNSLLNPKALLFFLVFLPQFVQASRGSLAWQLAQLGVTLSLMALGFNALLGYFSGRIGSLLQGQPALAKWQGSLLAVVMLALAIRLLSLEQLSRGE